MRIRRGSRQAAAASPAADGAAAIQAEGLVKRFDELEAVRGVSFSVPPGQTFGFLGPNGAGKSTTISMLCTLLQPSAGRASVAGFDVVERQAEVRRRIGLVFQDTTLDDYLTAEENLRFHAELYGVPRDTVAARLNQVLDLVGLGERRGSQVRTFSGGMKRRLEISRGLLHSPRVLFLDEPTIGLDPQFLTTHYMDEAEYCDRISIIDNGTIVVEGTPDELKASVGKDRVTLRSDDDAAAIAALRVRFGLDATVSEDAVTFHIGGGEEFVPRLFAELGVRIRAISVARPTLDDVFMSYTGRTIRDAEASASERLRSVPWARMRR